MNPTNIYLALWTLFLSLQPGGSSDGLKSSDVDPRLVFHYGFPSGCNKFAYDPLQKILAAATKYVSLITAMWLNCNEALEDEDLFKFTLSLFFFLFRDGRIKLYGRHNTQALLESSEAVSTKFLQVPFLISLWFQSVYVHLINELTLLVIFNLLPAVPWEPRHSSECNFHEPHWGKLYSSLLILYRICAYIFPFNCKFGQKACKCYGRWFSKNIFKKFRFGI